MNHVSVSPTYENGPTQEQRKTQSRVGIEPTTFGLDQKRSSLVINWFYCRMHQLGNQFFVNRMSFKRKQTHP